MTSLEITYFKHEQRNLPDFLTKTSLVVPIYIKAKNDKTQRVFFRAFTCVEVIKSVLGIHNRLILTPYQLYKHIKTDRSLSAIMWKLKKGDYHGIST